MLFNQAVDLPEALRNPAVTVQLMPEQCRYSLRVKASDIAAFKKASNLKLPTRIGKSDIGKDMSIFCIGPDEWAVNTAPKAKAKLDRLFVRMAKKLTISATDISHRNVGFTVTGTGAENLLSVGCPQDMSRGAFPVGRVARTVFESAPVLIIRTGETAFMVECWRSYGPYMRDFFARAIIA